MKQQRITRYTYPYGDVRSISVHAVVDESGAAPSRWRYEYQKGPALYSRGGFDDPIMALSNALLDISIEETKRRLEESEESHAEP